MRETFTPLFEQYGVQLVMSGREYDYERTVPIDGVTYIVSGAGAEVRRTGTEESTAYAAATFHFVRVNISRTTSTSRPSTTTDADSTMS